MEMKLTTSAVKRHRKVLLLRVLTKINALIEEASFRDTRWLFDWDTKEVPVNNISMCNIELDTLTLLQNEKILSIRTEPTPDICLSSGDIAKEFRQPKDYKVSESIFYLPDQDLAGRYYHTAVWVTDFDIDRFRAYCEQNDINLYDNTVICFLEMDSNTPVVTVGLLQYRLRSMQDGSSPQLLIQSAIQKCEANNIDTIVITTAELDKRFKNKSLSQILKDSLFAKSSPLGCFVQSVSHSSLTFTRKRSLTSAEVKLITDKANVI